MLSQNKSGAIQRRLNKSFDSSKVGSSVQGTLPNKLSPFKPTPGQAASKAAHEGVSQPGKIASALAKKQKSQKAPFDFRGTTKFGEVERKASVAPNSSSAKESLQRAIGRRTEGPSRSDINLTKKS